MRILICTGIFPPEIGGPATYSEFLAWGLKKLGHEVRVITYGNSSVIASDRRERGNLTGVASSQTPRNDDYLVTRVTRSWFKPWHYYKYFRAVKKFGRGFDIFYAQDPVSAGYPTSLAARVLKKPYVVKITGDYSWEQAMGRGLTDKLIDEFQKLPRYPKKIAKMRDIQIRVCKAACKVVVPSLYLKNLVMGWGVKESHVEVIYNAIPPLHLPLVKGEKERGSEFLIVSAGRDVPWKGFELLRKAVGELQQIYPDIRLEIYHDLPRAELYKKFGSSDLFVLNTGYEGLSHTILEAMSAGLPVIATRIGGNAELVEDKVSGILIEYNNKEQLKKAILQVYSDPALRQKLASSARSAFEKFKVNLSKKNMIERTIKILQKCVS